MSNTLCDYQPENAGRETYHYDNTMASHGLNIWIYGVSKERTIARYVKLRVAHAPGMQWTFSPLPTSKETAS